MSPLSPTNRDQGGGGTYNITRDLTFTTKQKSWKMFFCNRATISHGSFQPPADTCQWVWRRGQMLHLPAMLQLTSHQTGDNPGAGFHSQESPCRGNLTGDNPTHWLCCCCVNTVNVCQHMCTNQLCTERHSEFTPDCEILGSQDNILEPILKYWLLKTG